MGRVVALDLVGRDVSLSKTIDKAQNRLTDFTKTIEHANRKQRAQFDTLGTAGVVAGTALVAGFGLAVKASMDFDKAMSGVAAVSNASGKSLDDLRKAALQAGKDTAFSATQAATAEAELAKVGISASDIIGGALKGSLSLAAAGQLDLAESATLSGQAMKIFKLEGKDVGRIADSLAAGANKSAADVHQLGESLRAGGQVAAQFGLGLEDTVGVLALFSDNALIGSDAGTSLKTMLMALANPSDKSRAAMEDLGLAAYDASGRFVGLESLAGQLKAKLAGLTQEQRDAALAQIFGSDAMRAASILYKVGADGVKDYTAAVSEHGAAAKVAAVQMDNLAGDLEKLKGSIETALIEGGSAATGALRGMVQAADKAIGVFSALPGPVQGALTVTAGLAGAASLAAGAFVLAVPKVVEFKEALALMGPRAQSFGKGLGAVGSFLTGPWGIGIAAGVLALGYFATKHEEAEARVQELTEAIKADSGAFGENTRAKVVNRLETEGLLKDAQKLGISLQSFTDAALGNKPAIAGITEQLKAQRDATVVADAKLGIYTQGYNRNTEAAHRVMGAISGTNAELAEAREAHLRTTDAQKGTTQATKSSEETFIDYGKTVEHTTEQINEVRTALSRYKSTAGDADMASIQFRDDVATLTDKLKSNGATLSLNSSKGRENRTALIQAAKAANEHALKVFDETKNVDKANEAFQRHVVKLRSVLTAAGLSKEAIDKLIRKYLEMPKAINDATGKIKTPKDVNIRVSADGATMTFKGSRLKASVYAKGGEVPMQPGGSRNKDSVNAMLRVGEHVWTPEEVDKVGGHQQMLRLRQQVRTGHAQLPAFAKGGAVGVGHLPSPHMSGPSLTQLNKYLSKRDSAYQRMANDLGNFLATELTARLGGPGKKAVDAARTQIGVPYSWGGGGPGGPSYGFAQGAGTRGFDCSSLMQYGWYKASGKTIPRTSQDQYGWASSTAAPRAGDLGFTSFGTRGPGHVVMYTGPGRVIQAPHTGAYVNEGSGSGYRWGRPPIARFRGGQVQPGQTYMVGERGPETLQVGSPGRIHPNAGGLVIHEAHFHGVQNVPALIKEIQTYAKNTGGINLKIRT